MALILREAFRYMNYLDQLSNSALRHLSQNDNLMEITEEHMRSKVQPDAHDEVKSNITEREIDASPDDVINFLMKVYSEREMLATAINNAKIQHCAELDMSQSLNKTRQKIVDRLKTIAALKSREKMLKGTDYCFNQEGNQVQYYYDIRQRAEPQFSRANLKKLIKSMTDTSNSTSNTIDYLLSTVPVNYTPAFDMNEDFRELVEEFAERKDE